MSTIRVSNINSVTGISAFSINSYGYTNIPNLPSIHIDGNNPNTIDFGSNVEMLTTTYSQQIYSNGGMSWNGANGRITVPIAGTYCIMGGCYQQLNGNINGRFQVNKNGGLVYIVQTGYTTADGQLWHCGTAQLAANDYITCNTGTFDTIRLYMGRYHWSFHLFLIG